MRLVAHPDVVRGVGEVAALGVPPLGLAGSPSCPFGVEFVNPLPAFFNHAVDFLLGHFFYPLLIVLSLVHGLTIDKGFTSVK